MLDNETALSSLFSRFPTEKNIPSKLKLNDFLKAFGLRRTHYRLVDGKKVDNYSRLELSPPLEDSQIVLQSTYSAAGGKSKKRFIESAGAGPCVIATLFDSSSNIGSMIHLDSRSDVLFAMKEMKKTIFADLKNLQMRIVGGYNNEKSSKQIVEQLRQFAGFQNIQIVEEDCLEKSSKRKIVSVTLDTETGELFDLPENYAIRFSQTQKEKISMIFDQILKDPKVQLGGTKFVENILD